MSVLPAEFGGGEVLDELDTSANFDEEVGVCGEGLEGVLVVVDAFARNEE